MVLGKLPVPGRPTIWITVGQGPTALAVGAGRGCLDIFTLIYTFFPLSPSLWETARYRLKYCLKGPLNPKPTNQPLFWQQMILELKAVHCISKIFTLSPYYTVPNFCYGIKLCPLFYDELVTCQVNGKEVAVCQNKSYSCLHMLPIAGKCLQSILECHHNKGGCGFIKISQLTRWLVGCFGLNGPLRPYFSLY